jgi:hypothetical protein
MLRDLVTDDMANVVLKQLGASSVQTKPAYINVVKFEISPTFEITYVYEMREDETILLNRENPYPMFIGEPANEDELVSMISSDLEKFKSAFNSSNFSMFISLAGRSTEIKEDIEKVFLKHNVEPDDLKKIEEGLDEMSKLIKAAAENAKPL